MRENDISADSINGTGKDGRITKNDAVKAAQATPAPAPTPTATPASDPVANALFSRNERKEEMSRTLPWQEKQSNYIS